MNKYKTVIIRWELLRIPYNVILLILTIAIMSFYTDPMRAIFSFFICAILANVAYTTGTAISLLLAYIGISSKWINYTLWGLGTALSCVLTLNVGHEVLSRNSGNIWGDPPKLNS